MQLERQQIGSAAFPGACSSIEGSVQIRAIEAHDASMQEDYFSGLSASSRHYRFMLPISTLPDQMLDLLCDVDQSRHVAFMAEATIEGRQVMIAEARYIVDESDPTTGEFAISVSDDWQGYGIASRLMSFVERHAQSSGVKRLWADVLADNAAMIGLGHRFGFASSRNMQDASCRMLSKSLDDINELALPRAA